MRIPSEWRPHSEKGRLLLLSPFSEKERRATSDLARERNRFVARIADAVCFIYTEPGGTLDKLATEYGSKEDRACCRSHVERPSPARKQIRIKVIRLDSMPIKISE